MNKPTIAIGCIVQWYEVEMFTEYLESAEFKENGNKLN